MDRVSRKRPCARGSDHKTVRGRHEALGIDGRAEAMDLAIARSDSYQVTVVGTGIERESRCLFASTGD